MPKKHLAAIEEHVLAAARKRLREHLPQVEQALKMADGAAKIALGIELKPDLETGDIELSITCKTTLPGAKEVVKARLDNGQLHLI